MVEDLRPWNAKAKAKEFESSLRQMSGLRVLSERSLRQMSDLSDLGYFEPMWCPQHHVGGKEDSSGVKHALAVVPYGSSLFPRAVILVSSLEFLLGVIR